MTLYHPGILASKLEQLALELLRWSYRATSTREAAVSLQHQVETQLELVRAQSAMLTTQLQQDRAEIARVDVALMILAETCNVAKAQAETTAIQVQQALDEAQATRIHWETALTEARARFAQAEQALAEAQREMQQAQAGVAAAQAALERLAGTANEKEATAHLHDTQTWMQRAEREQGHAERELEQAQARVTACTHAIATATQAVQVALSTREQVEKAIYATERGMEYGLAAGKALAMGKGSLHTEEEAVKATLEVIDKATAGTHEAAEHLRVASDHEREAQGYEAQAHIFLDERIASLIALNRSELDLVSTEWVSTLLPSSPLQPSEALTSPEPVAYLRGIQVESGTQPDTSEQTEVERGPGRRRRDVLADGRQVVTSGKPKEYAKFNHFQGQNDYGYKGTCGLVSCQDVLLQFGKRVSENDVVGYAIKHQLCRTEGEPGSKGATSFDDLIQILCDFGVPAHDEGRGKVADLATKLEQGRGIIIGVNAGILWNNMSYYRGGGANHAVVVTGVVRDVTGGALLGFYINDSGSKDEHGRARSYHFVSINTMRLAWEKAGGTSVVTDKTHRW